MSLTAACLRSKSWNYQDLDEDLPRMLQVMCVKPCVLMQTRELLQELLAMDPGNPRGLGLLGSLELTLGHHDLARRHFIAGLESDPKLVSNLHSLARLELLEGNVADAKKLFQQGLELEPNNVYILQVCSATISRQAVSEAFAQFCRI